LQKSRKNYIANQNYIINIFKVELKMKNFIYQLISGTLYVIFKIFYKVDFNGRDNLPKRGGVIVMSNHISYYDPPLLAAAFI